YLASVQSPGGTVHEIQYHEGGLLKSFKKPRGNTSEYEFDLTGRLSLATNAAGGEQALVELSPGIIHRIDPLGRTLELVFDTRTAVGSSYRYSKGPDGSETQTVESKRGVTTTMLPDGTKTVASTSADQLFKLQAPYQSEVATVLPSGLTQT